MRTFTAEVVEAGEVTGQGTMIATSLAEAVQEARHWAEALDWFGGLRDVQIVVTDVEHGIIQQTFVTVGEDWE